MTAADHFGAVGGRHRARIDRRALERNGRLSAACQCAWPGSFGCDFAITVLWKVNGRSSPVLWSMVCNMQVWGEQLPELPTRPREIPWWTVSAHPEADQRIALHVG